MRPKHYSPAISRFLVSVLYHHAKSKGVPMTTLTNQLLEDALRNSPAWQEAERCKTMQLQEQR